MHAVICGPRQDGASRYPDLSWRSAPWASRGLCTATALSLTVGGAASPLPDQA
jgi:hypothetical protein